MKYVLQNQKIANIINELGEEYKNLLLDNVVKNSNEIDPDYINISKLIQKDIEIKAILRENRRVNRLNRMLNIMSAISLLYVAVGLILMLWLEAKDKISLNPILSFSFIIMMVGATGAILALTFKQFSQYIALKAEAKSGSPYALLNKWKEVEGCILELRKFDVDKKSNVVTLENLRKDKILSADELENLQKLLKLRNKIVHEDISKLDISNEDAVAMIKETDKTLQKLYKIQSA